MSTAVDAAMPPVSHVRPCFHRCSSNSPKTDCKSREYRSLIHTILAVLLAMVSSVVDGGRRVAVSFRGCVFAQKSVVCGLG